MIIEIFNPHILSVAEKLVCLDRDNTLVFDSGYMNDNAEIILNKPLISQLKGISSKKTSFCLVSNQSGVGRGFLTLDNVIQFNRKLLVELKLNGIELSLSIFCPHSPDENCDCRKPKPTMLNMISLIHGYEKVHYRLMYGDKTSDMDAANSAGFDYARAPSFK